MTVMQQRFDAVQETIRRIVAIEQAHGVTPPAIERIKSEMVALAGQEALFPEEEFAVVGKGGLYRLAEDADNRYALYAVAGTREHRSPVHDHTTWAVIAAVRGAERNRFYERTDNRSTPGRGTLRETGEQVVTPGTAVGYMPDAFHAIDMVGDGPWLQLHLYGRSLEHLPDRIRFETPQGGAYDIYPASPTIATIELPAAVVKAAINDGEELALLDVREETAFSKGHLLFAVNAPLSRLETDMPALVPRRATRVVVVDGNGDDLAQRAARRLFDLGWKNIAVLQGGTEAWRDAGYVVFSGFNVPSKAFGEIVEHACGTPYIEAAALQRRIDAGEDIVILDSRPFEEFAVMSIPGGIDAPGVELVGRAHAVLRSPTTQVVVNCAGRTRSIIGAQLLINAGIRNPVAALKDGTIGWQLAGLPLAHGASERAPAPDAAQRAEARAGAAALAARCGVQIIGRDGLERLRQESDRHALFCFDVRSPEEYLAGHLPGFRHAAGGQLVQATDQYVGTLRARIVVADDDGIRARLAASWLAQMALHAVYVLDGGLEGVAFERGEEPSVALAPPAVPAVTASALDGLLANDAVRVIDLSVSGQYRHGHVPGAIWASRPRLAELLDVPDARPVVLVSLDGVLAAFAAAEQAPGRDVRILQGGFQAWRAAGLPVATQADFAHPPGDAWRWPEDAHSERWMRDYITWEVALPEQVAQDGDARFRIIA